jgi:hypothetical protein
MVHVRVCDRQNKRDPPRREQLRSGIVARKFSEISGPKLVAGPITVTYPFTFNRVFRYKTYAVAASIVTLLRAPDCRDAILKKK